MKTLILLTALILTNQVSWGQAVLSQYPLENRSGKDITNKVLSESNQIINLAYEVFKHCHMASGFLVTTRIIETFNFKTSVEIDRIKEIRNESLQLVQSETKACQVFVKDFFQKIMAFSPAKNRVNIQKIKTRLTVAQAQRIVDLYKNINKQGLLTATPNRTKGNDVLYLAATRVLNENRSAGKDTSTSSKASKTTAQKRKE